MYYFYFIFLFLFINCNNQTQSSYINLEKAFINWYYKYNPTKATLRKYYDYNSLYASYDMNSYNEKYEDVNLFKIELSQIDETKLDDNQFRRFVKINNIISSFVPKKNFLR